MTKYQAQREIYEWKRNPNYPLCEHPDAGEFKEWFARVEYQHFRHLRKIELSRKLDCSFALADYIIGLEERIKRLEEVVQP